MQHEDSTERERRLRRRVIACREFLAAGHSPRLAPSCRKNDARDLKPAAPSQAPPAHQAKPTKSSQRSQALALHVPSLDSQGVLPGSFAVVKAEAERLSAEASPTQRFNPPRPLGLVAFRLFGSCPPYPPVC